MTENGSFLRRAALLCAVFFATLCSGADDYRLQTLAEGLEHPWGVAVISDREVLVTERVGRLRRVIDGVLQTQPISGVPEVHFAGQGGLSDIVLHPQFSSNRLVYLSYAAVDANHPKLTTLEVFRARLAQDSLIDGEVIFRATPSRKAPAHFGAKLMFLADGTLLVTSGDGFNHRERAQTLDNHYGKVLRINDDGSVPSDNPFVDTRGALPEIYSYGHRNLQGLATSADGTIIYQHEHGPKGGDELNILAPGNNYGWPAITYGIDYSGAVISPFTERKGMQQPIKYWVPSIAPSAMALYRGQLFPQWTGSLFITALVPGDVRRLSLVGRAVVAEEILFQSLGRTRNVIGAPDGSLLLVTDGADGRLIRVTRALPPPPKTVSAQILSK